MKRDLKDRLIEIEDKTGRQADERDVAAEMAAEDQAEAEFMQDQMREAH